MESNQALWPWQILPSRQAQKRSGQVYLLKKGQTLLLKVVLDQHVSLMVYWPVRYDLSIEVTMSFKVKMAPILPPESRARRHRYRSAKKRGTPKPASWLAVKENDWFFFSHFSRLPQVLQLFSGFINFTSFRSSLKIKCSQRMKPVTNVC